MTRSAVCTKPAEQAMLHTARQATERRYIILASDGHHVTVGRSTEPTDAELDDAAGALTRLGLGGWLCVMSGRYYGYGAVALTMLRELVACGCTFGDARRLFQSARKAGAP